MIAKRAHHVSLSVADIERSRRFYTELLGLQEIERPRMGLPGAWYAAGDVELHLIQAPPGADVGQPAPSLTPLAGHLAFEIEDYAAVSERLREAGLEVMETNADVGQMWVHDPDQHVIEFIVAGGGPARYAR